MTEAGELENPPDPLDRRLIAAIDGLIEHCDAVQVFVTLRQGEESEGKTLGRGDYFARAGFIREWLAREDERIRLEVKHDFESNL